MQKSSVYQHLVETVGAGAAAITSEKFVAELENRIIAWELSN